MTSSPSNPAELCELDLRFIPVDTQHAAVHAEAIRDSYAALRRWQPWPKADQSPADSTAWLAARMADWDAGTAFEFLIFAGDQLVGGGGLNEIHAHHRSANIGYWTRTSHSGRGIASSLIRHHVQWARQHTDLHRLEIVAQIENVGSWRAAEKAGAHFEGIALGKLRNQSQMHDARIYAFTPDEC